jgi:hypothetical protein
MTIRQSITQFDPIFKDKILITQFKTNKMTLEQIKKSLSEGKKVFWSNENYEVVSYTKYESLSGSDYLIYCKVNDHYIGLTHKDGKTLNGEENEFFTK